MARYPINGLTLAQANAIVAGALAKGRELNLLPLTVVVLDAGGQMKAMQREDGCSLLRLEVAQGKAFGCLSLGVGGRELARRATAMQGFTNALSDLTAAKGLGAVPVQGGVLVVDAAGVILGAVGVSGDVSAQDEVAALAGIAAAGLQADTGEPA
ncbi:heme-binding protein [Siccirubricoccus sp. KC 17139]|uniref:Heme-binding protein n=1 Tax=Siccirubricoccus soli TaxID=2899147 RepID=A0ABT1D003_9PROT|nr:heme-binding protein [Siccirubricoccus soli]MCO6415239.1 heme-binding protein [Siccirubricoccus soli]MCP2681370.1 heme-binding protein [Siccirubricoccus soli]